MAVGAATQGSVPIAGNDRISGDDDDNMLVGNDGDDVLRGRAFDDTLLGGDGDDDLGGGGFNDVVSGDAGSDMLNGGSEYDLLIANDSSPDTVSGGPGLIADDARVTRIDTLVRCRVAISEPLHIRVQPEIEGDTATFDVACEQLGGCDGTLQLNGPSGEYFGSGDFADLPFDPETFTPVSVQLTEAAVEALADGVTVQVAHGDTGGYRALMGSG